MDEAPEVEAEGDPIRVAPLESREVMDAGIALLRLEGRAPRTLLALLLSTSGMAGAEAELSGVMATARCPPPLIV